MAVGGNSANTAGGDTSVATQLLRAIAQAIGAQTTAYQATFPQATASATSATAGGASALPGAPAGYLVITLPGGGVGKVPYWNS